MRVTMVLLAFASLSACEQSSTSAPDNAALPATPAAVLFDGAEAATDEGRLAHGKRLATVLGCVGCHGENLQGTNVSADDPKFGDMNAPNLTLLLASYSDADLENVIRRGIPKDKRQFWFMPSESYQFLSDADLAALIAHLRTFQPAGKQLPPIRRGPEYERQTREGILENTAKMIVRYRDDPPADMGPQHEYGRKLSQIVCAECHNSSLQGFEGFTPNLDAAGAYSAAELETLLTTGRGKAKPDLGLMSSAGRTRFVHFTPKERAAIIAYVKARAERAQ